MSLFGRKSSSENARVYLNVYDLNEQSNEYLYPLGLGIYHSGVEISGIEYTFASEAGIYEMTPKHAPPAKFRESIDLGPCPTSRIVSATLEELKHDFKGTDYHCETMVREHSKLGVKRLTCSDAAAAFKMKTMRSYSG